jgi:23S rRNA U2552 (ribose-2'-O)-methylase RlmE/FtsJ
VTALLNNKVRGNFVIKVFDLLTKVTYQMTKLLCYYYDEVHVNKPNFSRPASSEKYIICLGFKGYGEDENEHRMTKLLLHVMNEVEKSSMKKTSKEADEKYLSNVFNILIGEEETDDVRQKLLEINNDHLQMQNDFINKGIHLIHTQKVSDKKEIKMIKEEQIKQAIQWCKNYNMEFRNNLELTEEKTFPGDIVSQRMIKFGLNEKPRLFDHFLESYPHMNFEYMEDLLKSQQKNVDKLIQSEEQMQQFQIKTAFLNPFDINEEYNSKFFTAYEIMNQFPQLSQSNPTIYIHHDASGEVISAVNHYMQSKSDGKFKWFASTQPHDQKTELYEKTSKNWVFKKGKQQLDFTDSEFVKNAKLPEKADLVWMDEEFENESEFECFPSIYGQSLVALNNLKKGGHMILKQWTFFRKISRSFMALMMVLFKEVNIVKPLASPKHSSEIYLVCQDFQSDKLTAKLLKELMNFQSDLLEYVENDDPLKPSGHLPNLMDVNLTEQSEDLFRYYCHYLVILNMIPKIMIDIDINNNPGYSLEKTEQDSLEVLQARQKDVRELPNETAQNKEMEQIYIQIEKLFKSINKKIEKDFNYLTNLKKTWDKANPMSEIKTSQEL